MIRILFVIMFLFCAGCATTESLDEFSAKINKADGINWDEAKLIAKQYLVDSKYSGDYRVFAPVAFSDGDTWRVSFIYKTLDTYEQYLDVYVDKKTGDIRDVRVRHKDTDPLFQEWKN